MVGSRTLKADPETENIPVVMASVLDEQKQGLALGANDYVSKPVNRDKLITALRRFVGSGPGKSVLVVEDDPDSRMFYGVCYGQKNMRFLRPLMARRVSIN